MKKVAEIYTHNKKIIRKIKNVNEKHPELFKIKREDKNGAVTLELPKDRLSINIKMPPKKEISEFRSKMAKDRHKATSNNPQICTNLESESIA